MNEIWKDIEGYKGHYQVSNFGNVRSLKKNILVLKPLVCKNGYIGVDFWLNGKSKKYLIHRLVAEAFIPNPNGYKEVNHLDENKENNCATNLEWCNHSYNMNYGNVGKKIGESNKGKKRAENFKRFHSNRMKNVRWINDGKTEMYIKEDLVDVYLKNGWRIGRKSRDNRDA